MTDAPAPRDRARTESAIVVAAREVLASDGFQGFGINAVARRAGCDKQLIYRYFGGLDGLIDAIGAQLADWIGASLDPADETPPATYAEMTERLILRFLDALRGDALVQKIAAWEIAAPSPLVARLTQARGAAMARWMASTRGDLTPPEGVDAPALNTFLIAGVQQLVLAGAAAGQFSGVSLSTEADWDRVRAAARRIIAAVYGA
jgi:AcrR family transcriptional regulator